MRSIATFIIMSCGIGAVPAQADTALPAGLQAKVDRAAQACADFEGGTFTMRHGAVARTDLDGDLQQDWVLDEHYFSCSSAASLYGSTGGAMSHFMVGDQVTSILNQGWETFTLGPHRVLLTEVHGTECGAYGYTACVAASVWDAEARTWRSSTARWEK